MNLKNIWPEWEAVEKIGEGSFGKVYKAQRRIGDSFFYSAVKVITIPQNDSEAASLRSEGMDDVSTRTYFRGVVDDCINEVKMMESLKGTANIVNVEDHKVVEHEDEMKWDIYIRMELLTNFVDYLEENEMDEEDVIRLGVGICSALECCQKLNIIHRDIKPENIFVSGFGVFKLGDFGISRNLEKSGGMMSQKGTCNYMAPEVYNGQPYGADIDTYSLGLVLYKLLNRSRIPFLDVDKQLISYHEREAALARRLSGEPIPPPCDSSEQTAAVILKACSYLPSQRFKTPGEMRSALVQAGEMTQSVDPPVNQPHEWVQPAADITAGHDRDVRPVTGENKKSKMVPLVIGGIIGVCVLVAFGFLGSKIFSERNDDSENAEITPELEVTETPGPEPEVTQTPEPEPEVTQAPEPEPEVTPDVTLELEDPVEQTVYLADVYESLTLRESASVSSKAVYLLEPGTRMQIVERTNETMVRIRTVDNDLEGYVNAEYIAPEGTVMRRLGKQKETVAVNQTVYYADVYDYLTLRNAPSTSAGEIGYLPPYTAMYVTGRAGKMSQVYVLETGQTGYVHSDYLVADPNACIRAGKKYQQREPVGGAVFTGAYYQANVNEYLTLRDIPSTAGNEIAKLPAGTWMWVEEISNSEFCRVQVADNGYVGYVMTKYLI